MDARRKDLDGLRGVAILLIVVLHYVARSAYFSSLGPAPVAHLLDSLWSGVDIFFVLSGYLIGGIVLDNGRAPNFFRVFYLRRGLRIVPVAFFTIAFSYWVVPLAFHGMSQGEVPPYAYLLFISNIWTGNTLAPYPPLTPMWSLAAEQQFYLVAPLLLLFVRASARIPALVTIIALSPVLRSFDLTRSIWDFPACRLDGLCAGVLVAILVRDAEFRDLVRHHGRSLALIAAGLVGIVLLFSAYPPHSAHTQIAWGIWTNTLATAAVLLYLHLQRESVLSRLLSVQPLVTAGKLSYFIYLMHFPVLLCISGMQGRREPWQLPVAFAVTTLAAWLSWKFLESPLIQVGKGFAYGERAARAQEKGPRPSLDAAL